jgi:hypothetical protein
MKIYKTLLRAKVDVNVVNVIEMIKNKKNTEETGVILKILLMESPTFAREYEETLRFLGESK